ncbi:MAG: repeat-containing protein [Alphaproteobacteria bacterium]|nr:repeat-containing protein [Alphaproteobacteria bacterium]
MANGFALQIMLGAAAAAAAVTPLAAAVVGAAAKPARVETIALVDSFRIGTEGNAVCTAQIMPADAALSDMFDRGYSILCRDASVPVGHIYALRLRGGDPAARLAGLRAKKVTCEPGQAAQIAGLGTATLLRCRMNGADVDYRVYARQQRGTLFVAEGLAGYEGALQLGLHSLIAGRPVAGEVSVATTGIGDPTSFARVLAGNISPERALAEAYRRNNSGSYAEAAEFFGSLSGDKAGGTGRAEALANEALQKSNLGAYAEAEMLFGQAELLAGSDPVVDRQLRNYRAMHLLNQGQVKEAYAELDRPIGAASASAKASLDQLLIDDATAAQLSSETAGARRLGASEGLSAEDKAQILDAQALQLRGSALRLEGRHAEAAAAFGQALGQINVSRDGWVAATLWMRAQILGELADISESQGAIAEAEALHRSAIALIETNYAGTATLLSAKGKLAAFYARTGHPDAALAGFREIVGLNAENGGASPALRRVLGSYFGLLTRPDAGAGAAADMFRASQLLIRPGVAQTQAVLARELGGGSDEAARLFRQSVSLTREIERTRSELGRLHAQGAAADAQKVQALRASLELAQIGQVATQAKLAQFPRYRALSNIAISLEDLQKSLHPGEAYYKMIVLGGGAYAVFITPQAARAYKIGASPGELERQVDAIRATISKVENDRIVTLPFDVEQAHRLYRALFDPVAGDLAEVRHLIFEPDGAMLRLPPNLLVMDQASVDTYNVRAARPNDDGFDFRGIAWLGRTRDISTAVSPRAFRDMREAAPSRARAQYIGFGHNQPADAFFLPLPGAVADDCGWSLSAWGRPISADELLAARQVLGGGRSGQADVVTGRDFTDEAIKSRTDLDQYRIVHFATHGMLAPPRPGCPARPALMTSFGGAKSDGLLSFGEIFDLHLDADVVILSACDTAGHASEAANVEAGLTTGGESALDGLVRAFVGAGGRLVIASHWPVPDDFQATQRLISGLFTAPPGSGTATALRAAQLKLMDDLNTSHPFYWSGFAVVGDGAAPLIRPAAAQSASRR